MTPQALTVLFADISGSTRMYQTQGDEQAHQQISASLQCMKQVIEQHGGTLLRTVGDSALASFTKADSACDSAIAILQAHMDMGLSARVGFHFGDVIPDAGDVYGNTVNLAARVAEFAEANEICTTERALSRLSHTHRENTHFLDTVNFKGLSSPISVYRVHWRTDSAQTEIVANSTDELRNPVGRALEFEYAGQSVRLDAQRPTLTLGRSNENDVVVDTESASRNHASIECIRGRYMLSDFSTNGTYVLKEGGAVEFVRRESTSLDHVGAIGCGFDPRSERADAVEFRLVTASD